MSDLAQRQYSPGDLPRMRQLWQTVYDRESATRREAAFRWITEANPHAVGGAPRHLILDGDVVAGTLGSLPVKFFVRGQPVEMHFSHDLLVNPAYRGLGLGKRLVRAVAGHAPSIAGGLWMTDPCYRLHQSSGWVPVTPFHGHSLILDARGLIRRRLRSTMATRILTPAANAFLRSGNRLPSAAPLPVREVGRFDESVDALFERVAPRMGMIAERKHRYLNWKYSQAPNVTYRRFLATDEDNVAGYAVTRLQRRDENASGLIVDLLADPDQRLAFDAIVVAAVQALRGEGAQVVSLLTTHGPFRTRLNALGFRRSPKVQTFVITNHENIEPGGDLTETSTWYLTLGDSDGDMWTGAQTWLMGREQVLSRPGVAGSS